MSQTSAPSGASKDTSFPLMGATSTVRSAMLEPSASVVNEQVSGLGADDAGASVKERELPTRRGCRRARDAALVRG